MPRKIVPLVTGEVYHVYNRGVDKRVVFKTRNDFERFKSTLQLFNTVTPVGSIFELKHSRATVSPPELPLVRIHAYCLLPNHFHIILTQVVDGGISEFMKRVGGGYTSYFNEQYTRSGSLFQGTFKRVHISTDEQLRYVTAYVNLNNVVHGMKDSAVVSSLGSYSGSFPEKFIHPDFVTSTEFRTYHKNALKIVEEIRHKRLIIKDEKSHVHEEYLE